MMRWKNGKQCFLWFCLVLCLLYTVPAYADDWTVYVPDDETNELSYQTVLQSYGLETLAETEAADDEETEDDEYFEEDVELINDLATDSNAQIAQTTPSNAIPIGVDSGDSFVQNNEIMLLSSYTPYDTGSMSTSVVTYMGDVVPKLGAVHYVLFRSGQYTYRLYYSEDMVYDAFSFSAGDAQYIEYDTRYYTWSTGSETNFTLSAGDYLVYSDLGGYPMLDSDNIGIYLVAFVVVVCLLIYIFSRMFSPRRFTF